ncbi:MAG: lytic murein transglycosylase [Gammaproteobacteria bacterium]|nr:lytic murein transglycosylase [Gammaproteobacteria bacterium]
MFRPFIVKARPLRGLGLILLLAALSVTGHAQDFDTWVAGLKQEAREAGISESVLEDAFAGVAPIPRIIELDRSQPEFTLTFEEYLERVLPPRRVRMGRERLEAHGPLLEAIGNKYGVQPRFIVALWGIETDFGRITGGYPVIAALATLAHDGRRSAFFRGELLKALRILDQGHIDVAAMQGSWAGAMGQVQFMPSSFLNFAQDYDGDGRKDIWTTTADAFASAANYLARSGWNPEQTWGRKARLPADFDPDLVGRDIGKNLQEWQALGVRRADGRDLPAVDIRASVVQPGGPDGPAYVVYNNYHVLLKWNRSDYFATTVGTLADRIAER